MSETPSESATPQLADIAVGDQLPSASYPIQRLNLVMYAGASGDFNWIHWNERVAKAVGLPNVIAHGMLTMAEAARLVTDWVVDPGRLIEYGVRFTKPVVVPDDDQGAMVEVTGVVAAKRDDGCVEVDLTATSGGVDVLGRARAVVRLAD